MDEPETVVPVVRVRRLGWRDLGIVILGIIVIYAVLGGLTFWLSARWKNEQVLVYANGFATQASFLGLICFLKRVRHWTWADLGWRRVAVKPLLGRIVGLYIFAWVINVAYAVVIYKYGISLPKKDVYTVLLTHVSALTLLLNVLLAAVLAPMIEETLFRGIIFSSLKSYFGPGTAAVLSAALFSGLHLQLVGFIPRFVLGLMLAYLYSKNRSLYPSMVFHSLNNLVATLLMAGITG
ncbi:CPBP family intramembrane glutamic endopeptidase [Acididesulfobacillus acetoxydans]|nr:CPBP family intramembrane glutamic endopeptidase [Acididesulfobacillus acetoxydans]